MSADIEELVDRLAIRDLVDAYAHHADRKDPDGQADVFTADGVVRLFEGDPTTSEPVGTVTGRAALASTFADLVSRYDATTYLNGQSTVTVTGDTATGETYCMAHHLLHDNGERVLLTMAIRYLDGFERTPEGWRIARRDLVFDWTERRPSSA
ncbi:nuclear transport factor 2 family protein [Umezawaea sp. NPDC059074]|uniref:nuclear transport factor 2 family protein n=1 Tax=Umezawaea sp. NPDC059074 TaxID=3346716 RepID=UPI0036B64CAF